MHPVHSCVIQGKRHYIHAPTLEKEDPEYFNKLKTFASKNGIKLKADQRTQTDSRPDSRRRKLLPIIFLAFGVNTELSFADEQRMSVSIVNEDTPIKNEIMDTSVSVQQYADIPINQDASNRIEKVLLKHYAENKGDPDSIKKDIKELAGYYSKHPEALNLLESLEDLNWKIRYAPHTFQTNVAGTRLRINEVTIYFDPRSGAKLKFYDKCSSKRPFCVASPADALLHELLHVQTILLDTKSFIAQGGLNFHMYPAEHERQTILKENVLYKSMSMRDHKPRPIRSEHTGRHVLVSCVTCIE